MEMSSNHSTDQERLTSRSGNRRHRQRRGTHFGDQNFQLTTIDEFDEAEWGEVFRACCIRSKAEWKFAFLGFIIVVFLSYFYIFSLALFGAGAKVLSGCKAAEYLRDSVGEINPLSGVMLGTLTTALIQCSTTTIAVVVTMVGAGVIDIGDATYLIMGANIGSAITNDIISLAMVRDFGNLERSFSGAVLHDLFNILTVAVLLPLEIATGFLQKVSQLIIDGAETRESSIFVGPIQLWWEPLVNRMIRSNNNAIIKVSMGASCEDLYPTQCVNGNVNYQSCKGNYGFIKCNKDTNECPSFFMDGAELQNDQRAGGVCVFLGLLFLFICTFGLTLAIQFLLKGFSTRVVHKVTNLNGYVNMGLGAALTVLLKSSSLTTSILTPLIGIGLIRLEHMFPLTLGANVGIALLMVFVALFSPGLNALQAALINLFFNLSGILLWYPLPYMRTVILFAAKSLGYCARVLPIFPVLYIIVVYFVGPIILLSLSELFYNPSAGELAGAIVVTIILSVFVAGLIYFCRYKDGGPKIERLVRRYLLCTPEDDESYYDDKPDESSSFDQGQALNRSNTRPDESDSDDSSLQSL